jgi:hypothetical protein
VVPILQITRGFATRDLQFGHHSCGKLATLVVPINYKSFVASPLTLCRLALFTLCCAANWWLKRRQPVSAPLVASRPNGRRRATLSQKFQKTPQFIT